MSLSLYSTQLLNGLMFGMVLIIISLGLTIIFGMLGIINFAHGEFLLVGVYAMWATFSSTGSFILGLIAATLTVSIMGALIERGALQFVYEKNLTIQLLLTFGFAEVIREGIIILYGTRTQQLSIPQWGQSTVDFAFFSYNFYRLFVIASGAIIILGLYLLLHRTSYGMLIRAGFEDREMVDMLGIDVSKLYLSVFIIGSAVVGLAGGLIAPTRSVSPTLGIEFLVPAFVVIVIGGMGSFRGTVVAGLLLGQVMIFTGMFYGQASDVIIYVLMALVIIIRPRGLFGKEGMLES
jgi:branched-chain amino acid transport system permease protein